MDNSPKLTEEEHNEVLNREGLISFYERTLSLLRSERNLFLNHLLTEKGLDPDKKYAINDDRTLTEVA